MPKERLAARTLPGEVRHPNRDAHADATAKGGTVREVRANQSPEAVGATGCHRGARRHGRKPDAEEGQPMKWQR